MSTNIIKELNIQFNRYYNDGYDLVSVDQTLIDHLASYVLQENFSDAPLHPGLSQPDWDADYTNITPEYYEKQSKYIDILKPIIDDSFYFDYWRTLYGNFDELVVSVNKMEKGSSMDWHWDGFDGSVLQLMLYVNLEKRTKEDGGLIEIGKSIDPMVNEDDPFPHWSPSTGLNEVTGDVIVTGSLVPDNNVGIVLNNNNPTLVHRVTPLLTDKIRYSVLLQCGYKHNWNSNKLKNNGGQYVDPRTGMTIDINV